MRIQAIKIVPMSEDMFNAIGRMTEQKDTAEKEDNMEISRAKMVSLLSAQNKLLKDKCAALEELVLLLKEELEEERYRHDRLQDFEVAESEQLAKAKATLRAIHDMAGKHFAEEEKR